MRSNVSWAHALAARAGAIALAAPMLIAWAVPASAAVAGHSMTPAVAGNVQFESVGDFQADALPPLPPLGCLHSSPIGCFGPDTVRAAYGVQPILDKGIIGSGRTIVIIDAFRNPTIQRDLQVFDNFWKIPDPPTFNIDDHLGVPAFDPTNPTQLGWSREISIDVEWAHAIAPGAAIELVLASSQKDTDMLNATMFAIDQKLGDVISQSFGEAEMCADASFFRKEHALFQRAVARGITLVASSGDMGTQQMCDNGSVFVSASTPASDPNVTGVGGTQLMALANGVYQSEAAWNSTRGASGGGFSTLYRRPAYQEALQPKSKYRGVPDVAYGADSHTGFLAVWSPTVAPPKTVGILLVGGTSAGTAQWAGIVALADQMGGRRLGSINKRLYQIGKSDQYSSAFHDITSGNNAFGGATGFSAAPGWDPVTGLGTPNVVNLISLLINDESGGENDGQDSQGHGDQAVALGADDAERIVPVQDVQGRNG
jgi:subtilase family serine protease